MNPRDRFLMAISRGQPDRVPRYVELTPKLLETLHQVTCCDDPAEYFGYEMREVGSRPSRQQAEAAVLFFFARRFSIEDVTPTELKR